MSVPIEATANIDLENEAELTKAVEELTKNKTVIMIAHRLKTVKNADCILVLDSGRIVIPVLDGNVIGENSTLPDRKTEVDRIIGGL